MLETILFMVMASLATGLYLIISRRRALPHPDSELDCIAEIRTALPEIAGITGSVVHSGNEARIFQDGELLEAMLDSIASSQHTVHFETFVWTKGALEKRFVALLCEKAQQGVIVRVLVDALGGWNASRKQMNALRNSGVKLAYYHPISRFSLRRFNNRTHRKLLIIDGQVAYIFGHGIKDTWCGRAKDNSHWRDTGVRLQGPVVGPLQSVFIQDWIDAGQKLPIGEGCFTKTAASSGAVAAHVVASSNRGGHSSVALLYTLAIASARKEVVIQNPYFAPEKNVPKLLEGIVQRGVAVHLMVPGRHTDSLVLRRAGQHLYRRLLKAGVRLYEYEPNLLHQKIVIVDSVWSHIGTTNFDARSLALNAEVGVGLLDESIAHELLRAFQKDLQRSREMTLEQWQSRHWYQRVTDWAAYQLHGQI